MYRSADYWPDAEHDAEFFAHRESRRTVIGHDTWIGHGAIIKPEVTVGHGAVVAAGAVVTKDVAPYTIVAGCPATPLRERQPPAIADRLIALAWWDWDHARCAALEDFRALPAEAFLEKYETGAGALNSARKSANWRPMRIFILIVVTLGLLAAVALAVYMRQYPMPAERWHVDPAAVPPRDGSRNYYLSRGQDAPRLTGTPLEVAMRLDQAAKEDRAVLIAGDPASGHMTYVARSRVFGFPDAVSIRLHEEGDATRVDDLLALGGREITTGA
jgi:hypothetical protein